MQTGTGGFSKDEIKNYLQSKQYPIYTIKSHCVFQTCNFKTKSVWNLIIHLLLGFPYSSILTSCLSSYSFIQIKILIRYKRSKVHKFKFRLQIVMFKEFQVLIKVSSFLDPVVSASFIFMVSLSGSCSIRFIYIYGQSFYIHLYI